MFEIGTSLREARLRQGIDLPRVEADTKIRAKYLRALEDEKFDVLPAETYVKGFLRTYAEYLGLDGQLYVDEFNSRFAAAEEPILAAASSGFPRPRPVESNFVVVTLAGIVAVTVLVVVAWRFSSDEAPSENSLLPNAATQPASGETTEPPATTAETTPTEPATAPQLARLVLTAARGDCWVQVRAGSVSGRLLFEGTLEQGQAKRFTRKRLWLEVGAASNLNVRLNGRRAQSFPQGPAIVVVTARGVRTVSTA
ncbi:MAG: RodZ domain-containing protein [Gaiellales bacterium]